MNRFFFAFFIALVALVAVFAVPHCAFAGAPPDDFPRYKVPGHEAEMGTLRDLFWLHYPGSGAKATLWDEWLPDASLWPAVTNAAQGDAMRHSWATTLSARILDNDGYVATHQHGSVAHQLGWPFPFWIQGRHGCGWHFSFKNAHIPAGYQPTDMAKPDGWRLSGATNAGLADDGWHVEVTNANAILTAPVWKCEAFEVPFLQLRWQLFGVGKCEPYVEWTTPSETNFSAGRRMYFPAPKDENMVYTMIPMFHLPNWTGEVAQLRICLGNATAGKANIQGFFSQYDTRHNINSQNFVRGCAKYFWWTRDLAFLRANINRMRTAIRYLMTEHHTLQNNVVLTTWVGHDGRSGLVRTPAGGKEIRTGMGIGNNYWDLLPFGNRDCYATIQYYDALRTMAAVEREVREHPEWDVPTGVLAFDPAMLEAHAADVKGEGNRLFWSADTGRFVACVDSEEQKHDYGFTFLNCEAIYYGFANADHAREIMSWLNGDRTVAGDTSAGADIYHWRFGARSTTKRNLDWYFWAWSSPESIPWGGQVQDGGAVLGFSYHDLMARLAVLGPDNAWARLQQVLRWFAEVQAAGGYRKYYDGSREGTMQGGGTAGGLGLDQEFFESAMVPQIMLKGFMGFEARADGFKLSPRLPKDWPELSIDRIRYQDQLLTIRATPKEIEIRKMGSGPDTVFLRLPERKWQATLLDTNGAPQSEVKLVRRESDGALGLSWGNASGVRLTAAE